MKSLVVIVTKGDPRLGTTVQPVLLGLEDEAKLVKHWSLPELSHETGGAAAPLVLVSHANVANFIVNEEMHPPTYRSGTDVADDLLRARLQATTYRCCLIAGCKAAEKSGRTGLYIQVGDKLRIPVVASTTAVAMRSEGGHVTLTPEAGGEWKVYFPESGEVDKLSSPRAEAIRTELGKSRFRPS